MFKMLAERWHQGSRTMAWPDGPAPTLDPRWRGAPRIDRSKCGEGCTACVEACPTEAITLSASQGLVDLGRCLFCTDCANACPSGAVSYSRDFSVSARQREELISDGEVVAKARALDAASLRLFGRSLKLRQVSAGGCNACEADTNVLGTIGWDLGRFGIQFVASPRHADGLLVTGPVSGNMALALKKTWDAVPAPKIVIAVGACAISGGVFRDNPEVENGAAAVVPVDLFIPGCPPHPLTTLDGMLRLLGRIEEGKR